MSQNPPREIFDFFPFRRLEPDTFKEIKVENSPSNLTSLQAGPCLGTYRPKNRRFKFSQPEHVGKLVQPNDC